MRKEIAVFVSILFALYLVLLLLLYSAMNQVRHEGGLGHIIGQFVKDIKEGAK